MTTLSLNASRRVHELVGDYETERRWRCKIHKDTGRTEWIASKPRLVNKARYIPAPSFSELIRILPRIEKIAERIDTHTRYLAFRYRDASTEPEAMAACESYLMKLIQEK
jgi:hypothetical protein